MLRAEGGCLCGAVRYAALADPEGMTFCYCRFCQRATGASGMIEPWFRKADFALLKGEPRTYAHMSEGSGKAVFIHFCAECGTKLFLTFERFLDDVGVYAGTFDDPDWFEVVPEKAKHIFLGTARMGTIIPTGIPTYVGHAASNEGIPEQATVFDQPFVIGARPHGRAPGS